MGSSEDTLLVLDPKPFKPFRSKDEYLYAMKEDLSEWFHCLYRIHISVENFFEILETGVILCDHAMSVQNFAKDRRILRADLELRSYFIREIPNGGIPCRRDVTPKTFPARDNVSNFITWCRRLGIPQVLLFETDDLVLRKNERSVVLCLLEVARIGAKLGMLAPVLVQMEEEIDAELAGEPPPQIKTCDLRSLDEMVRELVGRCTCPVQFPIVQVADGKYKIGDSQTLIFVRILRNHVMVRVGGGWDTLENYLDKHDPCRCGFRGHRNSSAVDHSKSPRRKISAPGGPVSRPKTPTSRVAVQQTGSGNNKQLIATRRPRSPSPERYLRSKSPFTPASPFPLKQPRRQESPSLAKTPEKRPPHSSVIVNSSSRNLPGTPSKLRSSSPNLSRVKSPSPEVQSTPKSRIPEPSRPKTPVFTRSQSPAPIRKPIALRDEDSNQRPKTPVQSRPKSPGLSQAALSYRADTARRSKSPGPVYGFTANDNRATSPDRSATTRSKSPGPYSQHSLSMRASVDTGTLSSARDMRSKSPGPVHRPATPVDADQSTRIPRPKTPVRRSESPCRIPRPKTPVQRSTTATAHPTPNKLQQSRMSGTTERPRCSNDQPDSAENNMESSGNSGINIEQISTMTLTEFKNLLSTSLSVPDGGPAEPAPASPRSSNNARANTKPLITGPKPQSPQLTKTARSKPQASPKRAQSVSSLVSSKDIGSGQRYEDTTRRSLPQSPVDKNKPLPEQVVNVGSSSTQSVELSSPSETDIGPPARPSTPSSLASRLPRPKTPSGIPRPSTPVYSSSLPTKAGDKSSTTPRARKQLPMAASTPRADSTEQSRLSESMSFRRRERSPSPPRRSVPSNGWFIDSSANPIENTESSGDSGIPSSSDNSIPTSGDDCKDSQQQQSSSCQCNAVGNKSLSAPTPVRKPSRLRPPSPSRVPLPRQSVETDTSLGGTRGRSTARTLPTPQFRKRPSSAGPVKDTSLKGVNAQESFQANQSSENSYVKKYFGRRNAKTIIKANSLSKAKSTVNLTTDSSSAESVGCASNGVTASNGSSSEERSRSRTKKEGFQVRERPKSAGPRPLVRQDAKDHSVIMVNRGGAGQHSVTVGAGEKTMYQTASKNIAIAPPGVSMATRTERGRDVSKSVDNTDRRYRPKSAGPRAIVSRYERKGSRDENTTQVRERMRNKYVSTENLVQAWENKMSTERPAGRRQLPPQPRRCVTPGARFSRSRSTTPNPLGDEELTSRPLEEIKAALRLPINGVHKIQVDPDELTAPPEDAEMFRKMEELFHRYREKEAEVTQRNGHESASTGTNSDDQDRDQVSADDEAESVDSNANLRLTSLSGSSVSISEDNADSGTEELDSVTIGSSVIAQLTEILKPKARKESPGIKSRIPAPQKRVRSVSDGSLKNSFGWSVKDSEPVNCDLERGSLISGQHKHEGSHVFAPSNGLHRDDSSTSLSDVSLNSSQGGYRCETPVPKLPMPLCTGRSTLVSMRSKDRSSSTSSSNGKITGRLVRAVSLDHSFTSTGNSIPDTSFSLAEDEDYV